GKEQAFEFPLFFGKILLGFPFGIIRVLRGVYAVVPLARRETGVKVLCLSADSLHGGRFFVRKDEGINVSGEGIPVARRVLGDEAAGGVGQPRNVREQEIRKFARS